MTNSLTGTYFAQGCWAIAEGAIAAGCRFFAGYPITPSTEIAERMAKRLPEVGGVFIQMEDELASMASLVGASYAGAKSMTATSGPGFSLMVENIGLAYMLEVPCVIVNIMRVAPSSGQPTRPAQGDVMQARWSPHGDVEMIALAPSSAQEMFTYGIRAFNLAERFRTPVIVLADENLSHMRERVIIPNQEDIEIINRKKPKVPPEKYQPFEPDDDLVPPMALFGEGYNFHVSSITHSTKGYPDALNEETHRNLINRLSDKIIKYSDEIIEIKEFMMDDAEIAVVAYGSPLRPAIRAVKDARAQNIKAGLIGLKTIWPFAEEKFKRYSERVKAFVVPEMNRGQILREVERAVTPTPVIPLSKIGGEIHTVDEILAGIRRASK